MADPQGNFLNTLNKLLRLVIGQDGYLESSRQRTVDRTLITVEEYIDRRLAAGASGEQVYDELMADLDSDISRVFGEFKTGLKDTVYGSSNIAHSNGQVAQLMSSMTPQERGTRLLRWQTAGGNVCEDCEERHGEEDTLEGWIVRGLPAQFGSRCGHNCKCTLVATDVILEPIRRV